MSDRTDWFPITVHPVRKGWYEVRGWLYEPGLRLYWNGWHFGAWQGPGQSNWSEWLWDEGDLWRGLTNPA